MLVAFGSIDSYSFIMNHQLEDQIRRMTPVSAPPAEQVGVAKLHRVLGALSHAAARAPACRLVGPKGEEVALPDAVFYVLERVAEVLARGDSVTVVPVGKELTTQQAADLINVSRQYLVRLLDEGRIAFTKTGKHRRLRIDDVLAFKTRRDGERRNALRDLSQLTESFGGYEKELK
jgi:excisionase family DNA binding protein